MWKPVRRQAIVSEALPDGSGLLFDAGTATAYPINESAVRIWELCDGAHSVAAIVDDVESRYAMDRSTVESDALKLLDEFVERQLLEQPPAE